MSSTKDTEASGFSLWALLALLASLPPGARAAETVGPIQFAGYPVELALSEISERTVRVELSPLEQAARPFSTMLVDFPSTEKLRIRELAKPKDIRVGKLRVTVNPAPLTLILRRKDGKVAQELVFDDRAPAVSFRLPEGGVPMLGLGEGAQQFDRRGAFYPMEPSWGGWNRPVLGSVVPSPFLIGTDGWALFAHQPEGQFDLRENRGQFIPCVSGTNRVSVTNRARLDLFVIDVEQPPDALAEYIRLTGRPALPPKWALGYFQSHRTLAGPEEPLQVARTFREKQLPCDALIYLGTGYCTNGWNTGHGSLTFNTNAFGPETVRALHDSHFKVVLHVNHAPRNLVGSFTSSPKTSDAREQGVAVQDYWARHGYISALGVEGWWPDDGDELPLKARLARHLCYYEGPLQDHPNIRPWSLHRTGAAGVQRFGGWIWSGDTDGRWATLAAHVSVALNHGLSLTPFWGSDTGGFYPTRELTGELYARWFQFSAFCPSFRSHGRTWHLRLPWGWNTGEYGPIENNRNVDAAELHNAEVEPICKQYLELRYRLLPYNYTMAREAIDTGLPLMRALWLHYPDDAVAVKLGDEYLWGRDILVAPVVERGAKGRRVYLPEGIWFDWWTGQKLTGKRWIDRGVDLATLPLYVRAGAVIPIDPIRQYSSQPVDQPTILRVHPGADGAFTLYDDDGKTLGYLNGTDPKEIWIRLRWDDSKHRLTLEPHPRMKQWPGGAREFGIELVGGGAPKRVEFRGKRVAVQL